MTGLTAPRYWEDGVSTIRPANPYTNNMSTVGSKYRDDEIRKKLEESAVGGGEAYVNYIDESEIPKKENADFVIGENASAQEFFDATNQANDIENGLVWVEGDAEIDLSEHSGGLINCTVASDRGRNGSNGALLFSTSHGVGSAAWDGSIGTGMLTLNDGVRLFGLRLRGPTHDYWDSPYHPGYIPFRFGEMDAGERDDFRGEWMSRGLNIQSTDVTVENVKLWGFSTQGISVGGHDESQYYEPDLVGIDVHDNMQSGLGYNVNVYRGNPNISLAYFNASRHTLATFGYWNSGYTVEDSVVGPSTSFFLFDTHNLGENSASESTNPRDKGFIGRASGNIEVRRVTFTPERVIEDADYAAGEITSHMSMGGIPWPLDGDGAIIEDCRCAHDSMDEAFYQNTSGDGWDVPVGDDGFSENVTVRNIQFGAPEATKKEGIGAPVDLTADCGGGGEAPDPEPDEPETKMGDLSVFAENTENGDRVNGATVEIDKVGSEISKTGTTSNIDIANGGVSFGTMPTGYYHITVTKDGFTAGTYDQELWRDEGEQNHEAMHLDGTQRRPIIYLSPTPEPDQPTDLDSMVRGMIQNELEEYMQGGMTNDDGSD